MQTTSKAKLEVVPPSDLHSFTVREFRLPAFSSPWHFHEECELTYIARSYGKRFVGDSISTFAPGELVLLGSKLPHYWRSDSTATRPESAAHCLVMHFKESCLGPEFLSLPEMDGVRRLLRRARRGLLFRGRASERVGETMTRMVKATGLERVVDFLGVLKVLLETKDYRVLSSAGFAPLLDEFAAERINRAYRYIFEHFASSLDHREIAQMAGLSPSGFCHYFRRVTGRTVSEFITEVRVGHASRLLIDTDLSIAEIAYASGYATLSNFNRRFHSLTGLTPREYRSQHQFESGALGSRKPDASRGSL
jgi:AraC-like DNA-binding protein